MSDQEPKKYNFYQNTKTNTHVSFKLLGENDVVIQNYKEQACFSPITYYSIPSIAKKIVIYRKSSLIPYKFPVMKKWIKELNELNFPCKVSQDKTDENIINFTLNLADFKFKTHLSMTLMLVRALFERGIAYVPEYYFNLIQDKSADKFQALQTAHKMINTNYGDCDYANTNHMIVYEKGASISKELLFERIEKSKFGIYEDYNRYCINRMWDK